MRSLSTYLANVSRRDIWFAVASVTVTAIIMTGFLVESRWGYMKPDPKIIYFDNWADGRTEEEAQKRQQEELAEQARLRAEIERAQAAAKAKASGERVPDAGATGALPAR
jgi:hypothetical protein